MLRIQTEDSAREAVVTASMIEAEAGRRILAILPEWKQRNMYAQSTVLLRDRMLNGFWTEEEQAQADALDAAWAMVSAIRAASDRLEAMDPIPADFADDRHWS